MNNFRQILKDHSIEIPIIQRDYAQGRIDPKATEIRNLFLQSIFEKLRDNEQLHLDFIYGSIKGDAKDGNMLFIPLDGQQRLTTLYLLYWYFGNIEQKDINYLKQFTYKTRVSSREFCSRLIDSDVDFTVDCTSEQDCISEQIRDSNWFLSFWENDPTIKSMLVMIDSIHQKFYNNHFYDRLDNITFEFFKLEKFGLDDDLYIKMNARGKALTKFESFKAKFEQLLHTTNVKLEKRFSKRIDGVWTDFFWQYRDNSFLIDDVFMRYFYFITEMLYYNDYSKPLRYKSDEPIISFDIVKDIYKKEDNTNFLFDALDKVYEIFDTSTFFNGLFVWEGYEKSKVALFDRKLNLFDRCIHNESFGIYEKTILFLILKQSIKDEISKPNDDLADSVRVLRNLLLRVRQQNKTDLNSNLRYGNISKYLKSVVMLSSCDDNVYDIIANSHDFKLSGFGKKSVEYEVNKAGLITDNQCPKETIFHFEDHPLLKGSIHNITVISVDHFNAFDKVWSNQNNSLIIRSLLTVGDYSIHTGGTYLGDKYYLGDGLKWHTILTTTDKKERIEVKNVINKFLKYYLKSQRTSRSDKMEEIIETWLAGNSNRDWRYYFIKYPAITSSQYNLFSWSKDDTNFELRNLSKDSLRGWHINPYVRTVITTINDENICDIEKSWSKTSDETPLYLDGIELWCAEDGWRVYEEGTALEDQIINKFGLQKLTDEDDLSYFLLKDTTEQDRIEIAVDFIDAVQIYTVKI